MSWALQATKSYVDSEKRKKAGPWREFENCLHISKYVSVRENPSYGGSVCNMVAYDFKYNVFCAACGTTETVYPKDLK